MAGFMVPEVDYIRHTSRRLVAVPLATLVVALLVIGGWYVATGAPVNSGVDFTDGIEFRIAADAPQSKVAAASDSQPESVHSVTTDGTYAVTFQLGSTISAGLQTQAEDVGLGVRSIDAVSASFGGEMQLLALGGPAVAPAGMSALVFAMFHSFVPSTTVVLSMFSDIVTPVALMSLFGIELSLGIVAALLILIEYSVDSDILLNNHVPRRSGNLCGSIVRAIRTGVTMMLTPIAAMIVVTIMATSFETQLLVATGTTFVSDLTIDLANTYMLNVTFLRWYKFEGATR